MYAIWNPLGLAFEVGGRLTSMSDPSERDVNASDSRVLDRKKINLGKIVNGRPNPGWDRSWLYLS